MWSSTPDIEGLAYDAGVGPAVEEREQLPTLQKCCRYAPAEGRRGGCDGIADAHESRHGRPAVQAALPAVGVAQRAPREDAGHRACPCQVGPFREARDGAAGGLECDFVSQVLQGNVGGRTDQKDREVTTFVQEDEGLIPIEVGLPEQRVGHRTRLGSVVEAVLAVDVRHAAQTARQRAGTHRISGPPRPAGCVDHQVSVQPYAVDHEPGGPSRLQD
jgi:hypothetical protein